VDKKPLFFTSILAVKLSLMFDMIIGVDTAWLILDSPIKLLEEQNSKYPRISN
jgi:hypothetical protein